MKRILLLAVMASLPVPGAPRALAAPPSDSTPVQPFELDAGSMPSTPIDEHVQSALRRRGLDFARPCTDEVFVRRVFLDVIGTIPDPREVRAFLDNRTPGKRAALVDALLQRDEFAEYASLRWCDALRVKAEFPINLWPNAVQAYHRWVRDALKENLPYDRFARALLVASGSNFRDPPVNFWRAVQNRDPAGLAGAVALTFMGTRLEKWPADRRAGMAAFFSRVAYKKTAEWKEEIVLLDPAPAAAFDAAFPDGSVAVIPADADPREVFADWLVTPGNPWFARAAANRVWCWLLGRGVVHEADDLRPDNPPSVPGLLEHLAKDLVDAKWDLRALYRRILNSRTYQQSPIPRGDPAAAEATFGCYPVRRLDAEVLIDALDLVGGTGEGYTSNIPEPFTFLPEGQRTISLADGSITSPFLEMFGRPARDTGLASERSDAPTDAQRLFLLNSSEILRRVERSPRLAAAWTAARGDPAETVRQTFLSLLSRYPVEAEAKAALAYFRTAGRNGREAAFDLAWALLNSKEFLYRH